MDKAEVIALCYGLNRGYSVFSNKYRNASGEQVVKFEINSKLDYYTIESIYQYAFNNEKSHEFQYLDSIIPETDFKAKKQSKNDYYILDKLVVGERIEPGDEKWWNKLLNIFFQKNQGELFKPFLKLVFKKIKEDLDDKYSNQLENKDSELQLLIKENSELSQKLKHAEKKETKSEKPQPKYTEAKSNEFVLHEPEIKYSTKKDVENKQLIDLQATLRDHEKLLDLVNKQKRIKNVQELISDFNKKRNNEELFNNQE